MLVVSCWGAKLVPRLAGGALPPTSEAAGLLVCWFAGLLPPTSEAAGLLVCWVLERFLLRRKLLAAGLLVAGTLPPTSEAAGDWNCDCDYELGAVNRDNPGGITYA